MRPITMFLPLLCVALASCSAMMESIHKDDEVKREITFVKDFCAPTALPGTTEGFKAVIEAKRKELESAQSTIEASHFHKLSQELQSYTAKSELLNGRFNEACRIRALCLYRKKTDGECVRSVDQYESRGKDLTQLLKDLEQFGPTAPAKTQ